MILESDSPIDSGELNSEPIWLPEPAQNDNSYAHRGEHTLDWLARSSTPLARESRRFLNDNLSRFPVETQQYFRHRLRSRWYDTLFELVVARFLQEIGAEVSFEVKNRQGKCPDFIARFPDAPIIVEAVSPVYNPEVESKSTGRVSLLNFIESKIPNGWQCTVWELPHIGPSDSKREFKKAIERMLELPVQASASRDVKLVHSLSTGLIRLQLSPSITDGAKIIVEPPLTAWGDSEKRIKSAIHRKRKQVRNSDLPVLLAVQNSSIVASFEDYDIALFGRTFERQDGLGRVVETGFRPTGTLNQKRDRAPTYAGVLAFLEMSFPGGGPTPVFYHHSRFSGMLPKAVLELEVRRYDEQSARVRVKESERADLMRGLGFVRL
ncbi:MAG TPA: hypothetical protein VN937_08680 [Blastocatellia bacterium]|nr:hypothetical protein [Blastocatellia bacterium]